MRKFLAILGLGVGLVTAQPAHADYFVWLDSGTYASMSFPDTWEPVNNQNPADIFTVIAADAPDRASCHLRAQGDRRFVIYPPNLSGAVQKTSWSRAFWEDFVTVYDKPVIQEVQDGGLGRAWASYAMVSYSAPFPQPEGRRASILFAGVYYDRAYIAECSSSLESFAYWKPEFLSFVKSIDFRKTTHELVSGHYRDFIGEVEIEVPDEEKKAFSLY